MCKREDGSDYLLGAGSFGEVWLAEWRLPKSRTQPPPLHGADMPKQLCKRCFTKKHQMGALPFAQYRECSYDSHC